LSWYAIIKLRKEERKAMERERLLNKKFKSRKPLDQQHLLLIRVFNAFLRRSNFSLKRTQSMFSSSSLDTLTLRGPYKSYK